jgi:hypothetical protein
LKRSSKSQRKKTKRGKAVASSRPKDLRREIIQAPSASNQAVRAKDFYLLLGLLIAASLFVFRDYLLLKKAYLFKDIGSDSVNTWYPHFVHLVDYLRTEGMPAWSFNQGMGQSVFPLGAGDVFLPVFYVFGRNQAGFAMAYVEVFKIIIGGSFFFWYLRMLLLSRLACIVGGLLFAFSGYMILGGQWYHFSYDAMCCAFLLFAFEKLYQCGVWWLLPLPFALLAAYQPFYLYLYGLFILVYATIRFLETESWNLRNYTRLLMRVGTLSALGIALSGIFLFENVQALLLSPRGGEVSYFQKLSSKPFLAFATAPEYTSMALRLFSNDLQGTGSDFKGWSNYFESPTLYCGLIALLLAPQFFVFLDRQRRKIFLLFSGVCLLALVFPYARYLFWGFTGNYYRTFSFFISLALLLFGLRGLSHVDESRSMSRPVLFATAIVLLGLLLGASRGAAGVNQSLLIFVVSMLILYTLIAAGLLVGQYQRFWGTAIIALVCVEVAHVSAITVNKRPVVTAAELSQRVGFNDYTVDAVRYLETQDKGFYRLNKHYSSGPAKYSSLNDAKVQRYYGSSSYDSFNQENYIQFLEGMDVVARGNEIASRWAKGLNRPMLRILGSVKYALTKTADNNLQANGYRPMASFGDVHLYQNTYFLPLGFAYDSFVLASDFSRLNTAQKDRVILKAFVIDNSQQEHFSGLQRLQTVSLTDDYPAAEFQTDLTSRRASTLSMLEHGQNKIRGTITIDKKQLLFFSIPFDVGWSAIVDGKPARLEKVDFGMTGILLDKGKHSIELKFRPRFLTLGLIVSVAAVVVFGVLFLLPVFKRKREAVRAAASKDTSRLACY